MPKKAKQSGKKKFPKWAIILIVLVILGVIGMAGGDSSDDSSSTPSETATAETEATASAEATEAAETAEATEPEAITFTLTAGETGEYGEEVTFNANTDMPETKAIYHIPAGDYTVTNVGNYTAQLNVYSDATNVTEEGYEEPADGQSTLINSGESADVTVQEGYYVDITEPDVLEFTAK